MELRHFITRCLLAAGLGLAAAAATPALVQDGQVSGGISGRVLLPSGHSIGGTVRITLRNALAPLLTLAADKNGEFRIQHLRDGTYYLDFANDNKLFEPATHEVQISKGVQVVLTVHLKLRDERPAARPRGGTISLAELDRKIPEPARKEYEKAAKLINKGEIEQAIPHLRQALAIYPDYQAARNDLGTQYLKLKRLDEAAEQFEIALKADPQAFNPRLNLGIILVERKDYGPALVHLDRAVAIDSAQPAGHLYLGIASLGLGELTRAFDELPKALALGGAEYAIAHYYLAFCYMRKGERQEATRELKAYLEKRPAGELAGHARALLESLEK